MLAAQLTLWALFIPEGQWEEESCLGRWVGKMRQAAGSQLICNAVLWLLVMCTFNISLLAISQAWSMNDLTQFLLLVYILAPAPATLPVMEERLWCEPASPRSLACFPQPPPGSHVAARRCSRSSPQPHQPSLSEDNTWRTSSAVPTSSGQGYPGKERLALTPGAAPSPPSSGDDGFHRGDQRSQLSRQPIPLESSWKMPFILQQ